MGWRQIGGGNQNPPPITLFLMTGTWYAYWLPIFRTDISLEYILTAHTAFGFVERALHRSKLKIRLWLNLKHEVI